MNYHIYYLPFEPISGNWKSITVRLDNGVTAFISVKNFIRILLYPDTKFRVEIKVNPRTGIPCNWIAIEETKWTFGFKKQFTLYGKISHEE